MTPEQKIKHAILLVLEAWGKTPIAEAVSSDNVDALYESADEDNRHDAGNEVRSGKVTTGLDAPYSRHYESKSVAAKMPDGSWVGWTFWYGGGKHGEPEAIDWMDEAYDLNCSEEEKVVTVRTFSKPVEEPGESGLGYIA